MVLALILNMPLGVSGAGAIADFNTIDSLTSKMVANKPLCSICGDSILTFEFHLYLQSARRQSKLKN